MKRLLLLAVALLPFCALAVARGDAPLSLPPPPKPSEPPAAATGTTPSSTAAQSPNQALAEMAREAVLKSIKPEYEKLDNWGHQKEIVDGYHWEQRPDGWHWVKQTKKVNEGTWRRYLVRIDHPEQNLKLRFTPPQPAANGATSFQAFLTTRLWVDAAQEQWVLGVKGLNFHVEGYATIRARLDILVSIQPVAGASFGTIEVLPKVTDVNLELVDLTLTKVDLLHGDAARELGRMLKDIVASEIKKKEPDVAKKINAQIEKNRDKLRFSPSQMAQVGWEKIQSLLGGTTGGDSESAKAKP
jgi:hypothetical protein